MSWVRGRQNGGYFKKKIFEFKKLDCWLLKYGKGSFIPDHKDPCEIGNIYRFNIVLKNPIAGGVFKCRRHKSFLNIKFFNATKYTHSCSKILAGERLVLSIGFII